MKWCLVTVVVSRAGALQVKPNRVVPAAPPAAKVSFSPECISDRQLDIDKNSDAEQDAGTAKSYYSQVASQKGMDPIPNQNIISGGELVESYPMLCLHIKNLLKYKTLPSHQQVLRDNLFVNYEERHKGNVLFISWANKNFNNSNQNVF